MFKGSGFLRLWLASRVWGAGFRGLGSFLAI